MQDVRTHISLWLPAAFVIGCPCCGGGSSSASDTHPSAGGQTDATSADGGSGGSSSVAPGAGGSTSNSEPLTSLSSGGSSASTTGRPSCTGTACAIESDLCANGAGTVCADETAVARCDESGRLVERALCPSRTCRNNVCAKWDACHWFDADVRYRTLCDLDCSGQSRKCLQDEDDIAYGVELSENYLRGPETANRPNTTLEVAVPAATRWRIAEPCPDTRIYLLRSDSEDNESPQYVTFELPQQYSLIVARVQTRGALVDDLERIEALACTGTPATLPYKVDFDWDQVAIIVTHDPEAPAFFLSIQGLWDEPAP